MTGDSPVVLVVEDERNLADLYARWLSEAYAVRTAYDGDSALEQMDESVAVVLLDRRMPRLSGDEFLNRIRENGYDCRVAMVTAVEPDVDIIELGFDDYVVKPVDKADLLGLVEELLSVGEAAPDVREYRSLLEKRLAVESGRTPEELDGSEAYDHLVGEIDAFRTRLFSLAETVVARGPREVSPAVQQAYRDAIADWEERQADMAEGDPLADVANEMIDRYQGLLEPVDGDEDTAKREFLRLVADGFVAEGFWLDGRVLRALNAVLFEKYSDTLVVERHALQEGIQLEGAELYETSQAVRDLARQELAAIEGPA